MENLCIAVSCIAGCEGFISYSSITSIIREQRILPYRCYMYVYVSYFLLPGIIINIRDSDPLRKMLTTKGLSHGNPTPIHKSHAKMLTSMNE